MLKHTFRLVKVVDGCQGYTVVLHHVKKGNHTVDMVRAVSALKI